MVLLANSATGPPNDNTVEDDLLKRGGRKSRKMARRLKRAARQTERMAAELEGNAEAWFSRVGRGFVQCLPVFLSVCVEEWHGRVLTCSNFRSGAFCTNHNYDPSLYRKRRLHV